MSGFKSYTRIAYAPGRVRLQKPGETVEIDFATKSLSRRQRSVLGWLLQVLGRPLQKDERKLDTVQRVRLEPREETFKTRSNSSETVFYWRVSLVLPAGSEEIVADSKSDLAARRLAEVLAKRLRVPMEEYSATSSRTRSPEDLDLPLGELLKQGKIACPDVPRAAPKGILEERRGADLVFGWAEGSVGSAVFFVVIGGGLPAATHFLKGKADGQEAAVLGVAEMTIVAITLVATACALFTRHTLTLRRDTLRLRTSLCGLGWERVVPLDRVEAIRVVDALKSFPLHRLEFLTDEVVWRIRSLHKETLVWLEKRLLAHLRYGEELPEASERRAGALPLWVQGMRRDGTVRSGNDSFRTEEFSTTCEELIELIRRMPPQTEEGEDEGDAPPTVGLGDLISVSRDKKGAYHLRDIRTGKERACDLEEVEKAFFEKRR